MQSTCKTHISSKTHTKFWKKCKRHLNLIQTEGKRHTKIIFYELCMRFVFPSFGTSRRWSLGLYMSFVFLGVYPPWAWGTSPKIQNSYKGHDFIQTSFKDDVKFKKVDVLGIWLALWRTVTQTGEEWPRKLAVYSTWRIYAVLNFIAYPSLTYLNLCLDRDGLTSPSTRQGLAKT